MTEQLYEKMQVCYKVNYDKIIQVEYFNSNFELNEFSKLYNELYDSLYEPLYQTIFNIKYIPLYNTLSNLLLKTECMEEKITPVCNTINQNTDIYILFIRLLTQLSEELIEQLVQQLAEQLAEQLGV